jgi:cytochrome c
MSNLCCAGVVLGVLALSPLVFAAEPLQTAVQSPGYAAEAQAARALLVRAVAYYRQEGDRALAVFSRQGPFTVDNLYVFVLDARGVLVASGGPSIMLVGRDVSMATGAEARAQLMRPMAENEQELIHEVEYPFVDWSLGGKIIRKHTFFQRVGDHVVGVGYYKPRADSGQALQLLDEASEAVLSRPEETFAAINAFDKRYFQGDLYIFVVDLQSKRMVAHGYNQRYVGRDFASLTAPDGKVIGQPMIDIALKQGKGEYEYLWLNPVTQKSEPKHAYIRRIGNYLVVVGHYYPR